jgi:hypothetical protein
MWRLVHLSQLHLSQGARVCVRGIGLAPAPNIDQGGELNTQVHIDGELTSISAAEAVVYTSGDFDGNIDLSIGVSPKVTANALLAHLRLRVPGIATSLDVIGSEETATGVDVTFFDHSLRGASPIPAMVHLEWLTESPEALGAIPCRKGDVLESPSVDPAPPASPSAPAT